MEQEESPAGSIFLSHDHVIEQRISVLLLLAPWSVFPALTHPLELRNGCLLKGNSGENTEMCKISCQMQAVYPPTNKLIHPEMNLLPGKVLVVYLEKVFYGN